MDQITYWILISAIISPIYASLNDGSKDSILVNKCCERNELMLESSCQHINETNSTRWEPTFTENNKQVFNIKYKIITGLPDCGSMQPWPVLHNTHDRLELLPNGVLRHYAYHDIANQNDYDEEETNPENVHHYDYEQGLYCLDEVVYVNNNNNNKWNQYALVCVPETIKDWRNADNLMKKIIDPIFHGIAIICFLTVAIVYFIMPTLRDLVGNIITTICMCMIVSQAADMVRIFTEFSNHVRFMIADIICYTSLVGAFFWLNSLGYYIWRTFKSRNVFLRVTDGKKYCYYSGYAWGCTFVMGIVAVFAQFTLEIPKVKPSSTHNQEVLGSLSMTIYFTPVAFTILVNIFFYATTLRIINRMNTYGRIHHKLKHSFRMFLLIFMIMSMSWLFMLLSWLKYDGLLYFYIVINAIQAPIFLYVCIFNQKHVVYLLRKTCCYSNCICPHCRPEQECEIGDEMTAMDSGIY